MPLKARASLIPTFKTCFLLDVLVTFQTASNGLISFIPLCSESLMFRVTSVYPAVLECAFNSSR